MISHAIATVAIAVLNPLTKKNNAMRNRPLVLLAAVAMMSPSLLLADNGAIVLAGGQGLKTPKQPQVFVSSDGVIDVVYATQEEIHLITSRDRGASFTPAAGVIRCPNMSAGMRRGPRVVRTRSALVVTAIGGKQGKGRDGDLLAWHSADNGTTWSDAIKVNDVADAAREGLHGMAAGPNGQVWCVWLDLRNGKTEVYAATSNDDGRTWSDNVRVYRSPDGSVCECCHPSIVTDAKTVVNVMFRNSLAGNRDMYLSRCNDGQTFLASRKLGSGSWELNACPMDGGMLASDGMGRLVTVWRRENQVFAALGEGAVERLLGTGQQPWATWSAAGPVLVWTQGRAGELSLQVGLDGTPRPLAPAARDPVVAGNTENDFVVVCWEAKQGEATTVVALVINTQE